MKPKIIGPLVKAICAGWLGVYLVDIISLLLFGLNESGLENLLQGLLGFSLAYIMFGLPIALGAGLLIGMIIWNIMWALKMTNRNHSIGFGAFTGFVLGIPTYLFFIQDKAYLFAHFDILSTVLIGAIAGWVFYRNLKFPISNIDETFA